MNIWNNFDLNVWNIEEKIIENLSNWKKWNKLITELKEKNWDLIVNFLRSISKTPRQIAKILRNWKK
jgi:ADP-heptose:LPS heptosyltransferase